MDHHVIVDIPDNATVTVKTGNAVGLSSKLFEVNNSQLVIVPISEPLGAKPDDIFHVLTKVIGDGVKDNEIIAQKKGLLHTKTVRSPATGTISSIDHIVGSVTISVGSKNTQSINACIEGVVKEVNASKAYITITLVGGVEIDADMMIGTCGGEISYITLDMQSIDESIIRNKVVIIPTISPALASKFDTLGACGIIYLSGTHNADIPHAKIKKEPDFKKLKNMPQKKVYFQIHKKKIIIY